MKEFEKLELVHIENEEDVEKRIAREKIEEENSVEAGAVWLMRMLEDEAKYTERILLKKDKTFDVPSNVSELPFIDAQLVRVAKQMTYSLQGLYSLAAKISEKYPEIKFSFELDKNGNWIEYTVETQKISVGDKVVWENQGVLQWEHPLEILDIQEDPISKRKYAFVEGINTGIPIDELTLKD